jgi:hypothetical protein
MGFERAARRRGNLFVFCVGFDTWMFVLFFPPPPVGARDPTPMSRTSDTLRMFGGSTTMFAIVREYVSTTVK